jgi:hypothetical protein
MLLFGKRPFAGPIVKNGIFLCLMITKATMPQHLLLGFGRIIFEWLIFPGEIYFKGDFRAAGDGDGVSFI